MGCVRVVKYMVIITAENIRFWEEVLRPFEREILDRYETVGKMQHPVTGVRGWKGLWIRGRLLEEREDYVYLMFKAWETFCMSAKAFGVKIKPGTYQAFRTYFHLLKQMGLVRVSFVMPRKPGERGTDKVYYELVPERVDDPAWMRPFQTKYPATDWMRLPLEKRRELRRKYPRRRKKAEVSTRPR